MAVTMDGKIFMVTKVEHRTPGNLRAFHQVKMRDVLSGGYLDKRFSSSEDLDVTSVDRRSMEYLYADSSGFIFMDLQDYDQITLSEEMIVDAAPYLTPNLGVTVHMHEDKPIMVELPTTVDLEIAETTPAVKGATATNQLKEATCETGLKTRVPPFVEVGDRIKVSTTDGAYQSRA